MRACIVDRLPRLHYVGYDPGPLPAHSLWYSCAHPHQHPRPRSPSSRCASSAATQCHASHRSVRSDASAFRAAAHTPTHAYESHSAAPVFSVLLLRNPSLTNTDLYPPTHYGPLPPPPAANAAGATAPNSDPVLSLVIVHCLCAPVRAPWTLYSFYS